MRVKCSHLLTVALSDALNRTQKNVVSDQALAHALEMLFQGNEIHPFIHSMNETLNVNEYRDAVERGNELHFFGPDSAFQVPINSSNGNTSIANLPLISVSSHSQPPGYPAINANRNYSYQPPVQFPHVSVVNSHSALGQVLTRNNEQNTVPDFLNSFLRYQNGPAPAPTISVSDNAFDGNNLRSSKSQRLNKRLDVKQNKGRGEGNKLLSTRATQILENWYETNTEWPYPSKAEKQLMASAGGITIEQVNSWFANRRNRSQNTRPKKNMIKLVDALSVLCDEYQEASHGIISSSDMKNQILALINFHLQRRQ
eukprot:TsM_000207400 transcript=TsM_000207400 gene=TsM_000207400